LERTLMDKLMEYVREEFERLLSTKTGWGRNEVMAAFDKAWIFGMARYAREKGISLD
jgi:hypothetical protein